MLRMYGFDGGTPARRAYRALTEAAPEVLRAGGERLDLTVLPRWAEYRMPPVIPVESRLAEIAPVTLDGMSEAEITLWGGREKALEMLRRRRRLAVEGDRTTDIYDWTAWALSAAAVIDGLALPRER
ncbi:hypothetical protein [Streptomyces sp. NPDC087294]|uniref:hypothetical protein n=1 Tax=Streptomyces sp. NPDC087294 TaxID=3365777 RepID=UPI003827FA3D